MPVSMMTINKKSSPIFKSLLLSFLGLNWILISIANDAKINVLEALLISSTISLDCTQSCLELLVQKFSVSTMKKVLGVSGISFGWRSGVCFFLQRQTLTLHLLHQLYFSEAMIAWSLFQIYLKVGSTRRPLYSLGCYFRLTLDLSSFFLIILWTPNQQPSIIWFHVNLIC